MTLSRRELVLGSAAFVAAGINLTSFPRAAAAPRPLLTPIGYIHVRCADRRQYPMAMDNWHYAFLPSTDYPPSQGQQRAALLNIYRALIEGEWVEVADLKSLDRTKWHHLVSLGFRHNNRRYRKDEIQDVHRLWKAHDRAVRQWLDQEIAQFVDDDWRVTPSAWAAHRRTSLGWFDRAHDLYAYGLLDEALATCDEVIERYLIEDDAGQRALVAKFFWLREANRIEESNVIWDQIWRCIADLPAHVWGVAWQRVHRPTGPCLSFEELRAEAGVPQIDLALGQTPNERYLNLTSSE
jgi:hypothetical protein